MEAKAVKNASSLLHFSGHGELENGLLIIVNLLQFTNMAAPRGLVKTVHVIPVSLKPKRIRNLEYAFSI